MLRAYSYIRFSSAAQAKGNSLRRQTELTRAYCERKGLTLDDSLNLRDLGVSAYRSTNVKEGALAGFFQACRTGRVPAGSILIVESLDRLSRDDIRPALRLFMEILDSGVSIVTLQPEKEYTPENNDALNIIEPLLIFLRGHEESAMKSHRVRDSWVARRKKAAEKPMTAKCPAWLELTPQGFVEVKPAADAVRRIYQLCNDGYGIHRITKVLVKEGVKPFGRTARWNMPYVRKMLTWRAVFGEHQPFETRDGKRVSVGEPIANYYPAVVSEAEFYKAQQDQGRRRNKQGRVGKDEANLFTGLVFHAGDRTTMVLKRPTGGEQKYLYLTSSAYLHGKKSVGVGSFPYLPFEQAILTFLTELRVADVTDPKQGTGEGVEQEIDRMSCELLTITKKLERVNEKALEEDDLDTYLVLIRGLTEEKRRKTERIEQLKIAAASNQADSLSETQSLLTLMESVDGEELEKVRRRMKDRIRSLVSAVWVLIEQNGKRKMLQAQVYLQSGVVRNITVYHPALKAGDSKPQVRTLEGIDLRSYAVEEPSSANFGESEG